MSSVTREQTVEAHLLQPAGRTISPSFNSAALVRKVTDAQIKAELGADGGKHPGFLQGYLYLCSWDSLVLRGIV